MNRSFSFNLFSVHFCTVNLPNYTQLIQKSPSVFIIVIITVIISSALGRVLAQAFEPNSNSLPETPLLLIVILTVFVLVECKFRSFFFVVVVSVFSQPKSTRLLWHRSRQSWRAEGKGEIVEYFALEHSNSIS